ncbi:PTS transporter subunit EIIB [Schaalia sp. 19OD2882]|nr:PTS transporter subunit EIIB [Schaalia sp. 19OD2882]
MAMAFVDALGGPKNLEDVEPCVLRIRVEVADPALVDEKGLRITGVLAVVRSRSIVQVVAGPPSDGIAEEMIALLERAGQEGAQESGRWTRTQECLPLSSADTGPS